MFFLLISVLLLLLLICCLFQLYENCEDCEKYFFFFHKNTINYKVVAII